MRLWSLSPKYLDRLGLLAVWREGLLAKKVLAGKTKGYKNHPQLDRFRDQDKPLDHINAYLLGIYQEALSRGYLFDKSKISPLKKKLKNIKVSTGQIEYEFKHLLNKLEIRDKNRYQSLKNVFKISQHSLFRRVKGKIEEWEKIK